jgi:gluconate kinase
MIAMTAGLEDWVPIRVYEEAGEPYVDWCHLGDERFIEPFFDGTIDRRMRTPFNLTFRHQTPLRSLEAAPGRRLLPRGLIFHVSRCGSTFVAQQLAALPQHRVLSEAEPIDGVLRFAAAGRDITEDERAAWLRWIVAALARPAPGEEALFIKHDSWHTLDMPVIRRAFPDVPCVFVYRDPLEVLVSQMTQRAIYLIPGVAGTELFGIAPQTALTMQAEEFCASVLASIYGAMLEHARDPGVLLVNYRDLPAAMTSAVLPHFGVTLSAEERAVLATAATFCAKQPQLPFVPDSREKRNAAGTPVRSHCERLLMPLYRELEVLRASAT